MKGSKVALLAYLFLYMIIPVVLGERMCAKYSTATCLFGDHVGEAIANARCSPSTCNFDVESVSLLLLSLAAFVLSSVRIALKNDCEQCTVLTHPFRSPSCRNFNAGSRRLEHLPTQTSQKEVVKTHSCQCTGQLHRHVAGGVAPLLHEESLSLWVRFQTPTPLNTLSTH